MVTWCTSILLGAASLLVASFACAGADSKPVPLPSPPKEQAVPTASKGDVTLSPTDPAPAANSETESGLNCDSILRSQLIFQRGASTDKRMQVVIAQIQSRHAECAKDVWSPVVKDMPAATAADGKIAGGKCYKGGTGGFDPTPDAAKLKVGDQDLPEGLQRKYGPTGIIIGPRSTSGRDSQNNIIVYWSDAVEDRPSDAASCWLFYARLNSWHENFFGKALTDAQQRETELTRARSLIARLERDKIILGIRNDIVLERLRGFQERAEITDRYLAEIETNAAAFSATVREKYEELQRLERLNQAIADSIAAHNKEIDAQWAAAAALEAKNMAELKGLGFTLPTPVPIPGVKPSSSPVPVFRLPTPEPTPVPTPVPIPGVKPSSSPVPVFTLPTPGG